MSEIKNIFGVVLFADGTKTILELVTASVASKKSLRGANLSGADLSGAYLRGAYLNGANLNGANLNGANLRGANLNGANLSGAYLSGAYLRGAYLNGANLNGANLNGANLSGADLSGAYLRGAYLSGKKLEALRTFAASLYPYEVWAILFEDGSRVVRMGCFWKTLEEWEAIGIRSSNISEFPDDGSEISETRAALFELAKAAVLRIEYTQKVSKK